jgi:hypothetical protein
MYLFLLASVFAGSEEEYSAFAAPKRFGLAHHSPDDGVKMKQKHVAKQTVMQQQKWQTEVGRKEKAQQRGWRGGMQ